jgi:hypothetical protein
MKPLGGARKLDSEVDESSSRRVPIWTVFERGFGFIWSQKGLLVGPFLMALFFQILFVVIRPHFLQLGAEYSYAVWVASLVMSLLVPLLYAVGVHRTILLGERKRGILFFPLGRCVIEYTIVMFVFYVLWVIFATPTEVLLGLSRLASNFLNPVKQVLCFVIFGRLLLAIPSAAVGIKNGFLRSWQLTKNNLFRMAIIFVLGSLPKMAFGIVSIWIFLHSGNLGAVITSWYFGIAGCSIDLFSVTVLAAMLSFSYRELAADTTPTGGLATSPSV